MTEQQYRTGRLPFPEARPTGYVNPYALTHENNGRPFPPDDPHSYRQWPDNIPYLPQYPSQPGIVPSYLQAASGNPPPVPPHRPRSVPANPFPSHPPCPFPPSDLTQYRAPVPPPLPYHAASEPTSPTKSNGKEKENKLFKWFKRDRQSSTPQTEGQGEGVSSEGVRGLCRPGRQHTAYNVQALTEGMLGMKFGGDKPRTGNLVVQGDQRCSHSTIPHMPHSVSAPVLSSFASKGTFQAGDHPSSVARISNEAGKFFDQVISVHVHLPASYGHTQAEIENPHGVGMQGRPTDPEGASGGPGGELRVPYWAGHIEGGRDGSREHSAGRPRSQQNACATERPSSLPSPNDPGCSHQYEYRQLHAEHAHLQHRVPLQAAELQGIRPTPRPAPILAAHLPPVIPLSTRNQLGPSNRSPGDGCPPERSRRVRAQSETPLVRSEASSRLLTDRRSSTALATGRSSTPLGPAMQCAGYTTKGMRCKRMVKASAAINSAWTEGGEIGTAFGAQGSHAGERDQEGTFAEESRYCKDHVNKILHSSTGFYWRPTIHPGNGRTSDQAVSGARWVEFGEYLPPKGDSEVDEQTRAAMRYRTRL